MRLMLLIFSLVAFSAPTQATSSAQVLVGSAVNTWSQATLIVTDKAFDLAIQGKGFFALRLPTGEPAYSRYGEMSLEGRGLLVHTPTGGIVLGYCEGELGPIDLVRFGKNADDGALPEDFNIALNGMITAFYNTGKAQEVCQIALALFENSPMLQRSSKHLLLATAESGQASIGRPQSEDRASIFQGSLEELDEQMYRRNIKTGRDDRVALEMANSRIAEAQWSKQKTLFYVYELGLTRSELLELEALTEKWGEVVQKIVGIAERTPKQILQDDFASEIKLATEQYESKVRIVLGQDRFNRAKKFRQDFNRDMWAKFGTQLARSDF